jgi:CRISPR-associated protein Csd1
MICVLIEAADRFKHEDDWLPLGYSNKPIAWIVDPHSDVLIQPASNPTAGHTEENTLPKSIPVAVKTSGPKPALLVDTAEYVLGLQDGKKKNAKTAAGKNHSEFVRLLESITKYFKTEEGIEDSETTEATNEVKAIADFLSAPENKRRLRQRSDELGIKAKEIVAIRLSPQIFPSDRPVVQVAWSRYLADTYESEQKGACLVCGKHRPFLNKMPWRINFPGHDKTIALSAINSEETPAFDSFGESNLSNSPMCYTCAGLATNTLKYLMLPGRKHNVLLSKDEAAGKRGQKKNPLKNHLAVFWLKKELDARQINQTFTLDIEDMQRSIFNPSDIDEELCPPPDEEQLKRLCKYPWSTSKYAKEVADNAFYLAVISPNESRLVLREWLEISLTSFMTNVGLYSDALSIISPDGQKIWSPPIPAIFEALKPVKTLLGKKDNENIFIPEKQDSNILHGLLRCCYTGASPPADLLERAVLRFRILTKNPEIWKQKLKFEGRRMALVGAMKLILSYPVLKEAKIKGEQIYEEEVLRMEQLDEKEGKVSYLCGRLLALLEEIQRWHAFPQAIKATLVDRFYGTASTAPQSVFGTLLSMATKAHMGKLRKERFTKYEEMEVLLEDISGRILKGFGFPKTLNMREQAEFALGFYAQRALFRKLRGEIMTKP